MAKNKRRERKKKKTVTHSLLRFFWSSVAFSSPLSLSTQRHSQSSFFLVRLEHSFGLIQFPLFFSLVSILDTSALTSVQEQHDKTPLFISPSLSLYNKHTLLGTMPFWKDYIYAKPEVDDDDLPLPEYRIFGDDGDVKEQVAKAVGAARRTSSSRAANAKKSLALSPKRWAELLKSVGAKLTTPLKAAAVKANAPAAAAAAAAAAPRSPARSRSHSPSTHKSAARSSAHPSNAESPAVSRRASAAHKPASRKASRANSPSNSKAATGGRGSRSRSSSRRASLSDTPNTKWNVADLKKYAEANAISLDGLSKKQEILDVIMKAK